MRLLFSVSLGLTSLCLVGCDDVSEVVDLPDAALVDLPDAARDAGGQDAPALDVAQDLGAVSDAEPEVEASPPPELVRYLVGGAGDADVQPLGPGLILMGGGRDVDAAFEWWRPLLAQGDVVVIRASGADGYNDYLYSEIGGVDSVETLMVTSRALADDPYVAQQVARAEGVFIAGGDQSRYVNLWTDSALSRALVRAVGRGAVVGGTSAGSAVLGHFAFSAQLGTITSEEALADPFDPALTISADFLPLPPLTGLITDTHFRQRDRLGRLVTFVARLRHEGLSERPLGLGIDERTAVVVDAQGVATVVGSGKVYAVDGSGAPERCAPGAPLSYLEVPYQRLAPGDSFALPSRAGLGFERRLRAGDGALSAEGGLY